MQFKLTNEFLETLELAISNKDDKFIKEQLNELYPPDIAEIVEELSLDESRYLCSLLDKEEAADVLMELEDDVREDLLELLSSKEIASDYVENLDSDDAADLIGELSDEKRAEVISHIEDIEQAKDIVDLLKYDEDTAGGLMAKELVKANVNWTIFTAVREMRKQVEEDEIDELYTIYVVDDEERLLGTLSLKKMLLSESKTKISGIYNPDIIYVRASLKAEQVANIMNKYDLVVLPVVDELDRLIGRITIDDIVDVIKEEADKDYQMMSGISTNIESTDSLLEISRARLPWLVVALFGGMVGARIIGVYENQISIHPEMAFFMPLVVAMAGNAGVQSSALIVQGLANNSLSRDNIMFRLLKELSVGLTNGLICSAILFGFSFLFNYPLSLSMTVSVALMSVIAFASVLGALFPLTLHRLKIDPALATGPFITTSNDILGFFIYFMIGRLMYGIF
ncbi:MAG: magnesium transporter [Bacteroidales bacterium]|nr:magnesium transporter [Bacteroidales bacterium]